jgi:hypothetical protein
MLHWFYSCSFLFSSSIKRSNACFMRMTINKNQSHPLIQLQWLADWYEAEIRFISVLPSDISTKEQDKLSSIHKAIGNSWKGNNKVSFETIIYPDVPPCFEQYLSLREMNDLLVLSINHRNMLERFWHKSVVKGLLQYGKHPYLIIHK